MKSSKILFLILLTAVLSCSAGFSNAADKKSSGFVWEIKDPLYGELFSDEPTGLAREGTIYWAHGANAKGLRICSLQYGFPYSYQFWIDQTNENFLRPLANYGGIHSRPNHKQLKHVYLASTQRFPDQFPSVGVFAFLPDPGVRKLYVQQMAEDLQKNKDVIWAVSAGDETQDAMDGIGVKLFAEKKDSYPYIRQANEEVKQRYGGGRYGIPQGKDDTNPYRWMAYRRWLNDEMTLALKELSEEARKIKPDVRIIAYNSGSPRPYDYSRWNKYADIMNQQMLSRCRPFRTHMGFSTKITKDISGTKEFWACTHMARPPIFNSDDVRELMSQVYRNGGTGFHFWTCDYYGRKAKRKYMHYEYYIAPNRWDTMMAITKEVRKINRLKFPQPDSAILYSCDNFAAVPSKLYSDPAEAAYTLLGPNARAAFKFIDENQIQRKEVSLGDYKAIYMPLSKYIRPDVLEALENYVQTGGVLIVGPDAFEEDTIGNSLAEKRNELLGATRGKELEVKTLKSSSPKLLVVPNGLKLYSKAYELKLDKKELAKSNLQVLAKFDDKSPAVVLHKVGKGKVFVFGVNPFEDIKVIKDKDWISFFKNFHKSLGLKVDENIWRFQFPKRLSQKPEPLQGKCLTNNYIYWETNKPITKQNLDTGGTYSYSVRPDGIDDSCKKQEIPFSEGDLTDRTKAPTAGNVDSGIGKIDDWIVRFDKPCPAEITFDFKKPYPLSRVRLVYTGLLPDIELEASPDGEVWLPLPGAAASHSSGKATEVKTLQGEWGEYQYLRIKFGDRPPKTSFTLAEVEVWSFDANPDY